MNAPYFPFGLFSFQTSLVVAFVIGIGFGFFLERAGFGVSRKLAAQFYFRDLAVLKVMFTAIITAMTGVYLLSRFGMLDLSMVYLVPTFVLPQIVGGLLLGVGFVIGGYCPGTSCVSAATGRVDGIVYVLGMFSGLVGFGVIYPYMVGFTHMTSMGQITLPRLLHLPYGLLVLAVVVMALGAFYAAEWAEKKYGGVQQDPAGSLGGPWRWTSVRVLAAALLAAGLIAAVAGDPYRGSHLTVDAQALSLRAATGADSVEAVALANWIIQGRDDFTLVDLRSTKDFDEYHIPSAQNLPMASLTSSVLAHNQKIVLCGEDGTQTAKAWYLLQAEGYKDVYIVNGGMKAWHDQVLFPTKTPATDAQVFDKLAQVARYFGGTPQVAGAPAAAAAIVPAMPAAPAIAAPAAPAGGGGGGAHKRKEGC